MISAGLNHMARTVAAELAQHKINVNAIEPGWIDTPGERVLFEDPQSWDYFYDGMKDATPEGRQGEGRNLTEGRLPWCQWLAASGSGQALCCRGSSRSGNSTCQSRGRSR